MAVTRGYFVRNRVRPSAPKAVPLGPESAVLRRGLLLTLLFLATAAALPPASPSELTTLYGPEDFVQPRGQLIAVMTRTVSIQGYAPPFTLHLRNGNANGQDRVISATILVNGKPVLCPLEFWKKRVDFSAEVKLVEPSQLKMWLIGRPGSLLTIWIEGASGLPPDPASVAPPIDQTVPTSLASATRFLYTGSNSIQKGVSEGTIEARRAAVLRGRVFAQGGAPLPGVTITVLGHPELGSTRTRKDGGFDLAVNGGGILNVQYRKQDYLPADRQAEVPWQDYVWLPDLTLIPLDAHATRLDFSAGAPTQVARGSIVSDADGTRQATVISPAGGSMVNMELPDGSVLPALSSLTLRATEYTVGPQGPARMPAELPPSSAYTYAFEVSADEALVANARRVTFDPPLALYLENFLGFPTGGVVPTAYYDRERGAWSGTPNGRVVKILRIANGLADLDVSGGGSTAGPDVLAAMGIGDAERSRLAALYVAGQTLWRVPIPHLTPFDCNWPPNPPPDAKPPEEDPDKEEEVVDDPCAKSGSSIVECQNQSLGERIRVVGTPFNLNYRSDRAAGRRGLYTLRIPLGKSPLPSSLKQIDLHIYIAGQQVERSFQPEPGQEFLFTWDGRDVYGRLVQGPATASVSVGYVYEGTYGVPVDLDPSFGAVSGLSAGVPLRGPVRLTRTWNIPLGAVSGLSQGLGGWTLSANHVYDGRVLHLGDGRRRHADAMGSVISTAVGTGSSTYSGDGGPATSASFGGVGGLAVGADGSLYFSDAYRIRRVAPDGIINTVAGTGVSGYSGDGGPALAAQLESPGALAVGPDGSVYVVDGFLRARVRRITPDGRIATVAGNGVHSRGGQGDGRPATEVPLGYILSLAVAPDGTLALGEAPGPEGVGWIRRVPPSGVIGTMAGTGEGPPSGDGGPAIQARIDEPTDIAWGPDGSLYVAETWSSPRVRRIWPDGIITTVAGQGRGGYWGDGGPATEAGLTWPSRVDVARDGTLYISEGGNGETNGGGQRVRRVTPDGIITTYVGACRAYVCDGGFSGDGGPALSAALNGPNGLAVAPDDTLYVADGGNFRIRHVTSPLPDLAAGHVLVAGESGTEVYEFDASGRHLQTRHALTGAVLHEFGYDASGHLAEIRDGNGNLTRIERDSGGKPLAIVSPLGLRTSLALDANGYLQQVTNPAGEPVELVHDASGLLTSLANARGLLHSYAYDDSGRLASAKAPDGGVKSLVRSRVPGGFEVAGTSGAGRRSFFRLERLSDGGTRALNSAEGYGQMVIEKRPDASVQFAASDGTTWASASGPDPRFGLQSPFVGSLTMRTPAGLIASQSQARTATLGDDADPFSLTSWQKSLSLNGRIVTTAFDAAARTLRRTLPSGRSADLVLDPQGRPLLRSAFSLTPTAYEYDSRGRLVTIRRGERSVQLGYDGQGYLSTLVDAFSRQTRLERDPAGRMTAKNTPDGRTFRYGYDRQGNLTSLTLPSGAANVFTYNARGLLDSYQAPGSGTPLRRHYDLDGRLLSVSLPDARTIERSYNGKGRLTLVSFDRGAILRQYDDASGRLARVVAPDGGSLRYHFDGSLLTGLSWAGVVSGSVEEVFDSSLRPVGRRVNGQETGSLQYDSDGFLTRAGDLSMARAPDTGLITSTTLGNVTTSHSYTDLGEPLETRVRVGGTEVYAVDLRRDAAGRIVERQETVEGTTAVTRYRYDEAGRLVEAAVDGVVTLYGYDVNGNRTLWQRGTESWPASFDAEDRLTAVGADTYEHGPAGDLRRRVRAATAEVTAYTYDATGNLVSVRLPDGRQMEYVLDPIGRRLGWKVNGGLVQGFLYKDRLRPVAEVDGAGNLVSIFVYGERPSVPSYMVRAGNRYRVVTDHLGSPRLVIDVGSGLIVQRIEYDEFGRVRIDTQPGFQPFGFAGGLYDPNTGLVRFGERDYDPETGRWTTKDRRLFAGRTENLYAYASNDPLNRVDRWGRAECNLGPSAGNVPADYCDEVPPGTYEEDCDDPEDHCQQVGRNADGSYQDDSSIDGGTAGESIKTTCDEEMVTCTTESRFIDDQSEGDGPPPDGKSAEDELDEKIKDDLEKKDQEKKNGDGAGPNPCPDP